VGRIAGYARDGRGWLLNDRLQPQRDAAGSFVPTPAVEYYLALARHLGADASDASMELAVEPSFAQAADELLRAAGLQAGEPAVMLNPGAAFGPSKMWNSERYAALADELIDRHKAQIIINAAPGEATIARQVAGDMRHRPLVNMADHPNSLGLVKALLRRIDLLVTNDTGARHVAAALGRDVVTIFGSTDPAWSQIGFARERMVRVAVPCSPCQKRMCPQTPGPRYQQCMMAVTVEMALAAAEELLASRQHQAVRA
jgi:heptosyltransferase-2